MNDIGIFKQKFDPYLQDYLDKKTKSIINYTKDSSVIDYINYAKKITLSGGKRIRPYVAYLIYQALCGKDNPPSDGEKVLKLLVSLEIFHSFCLAHDDIIDKANLRHGISTSHVYIGNELKKRIDNNYEHFGISQAILVGDLLFNWACEIISLSSEKNVRKFFFEMVEGTVIGQMLDVESKSNKNITEDLISEINYLKTARYTFIYPLFIGASLSGSLTAEMKKFCNELGLNLGMAFQAQDDIFDSDNKKYIESQKKLIKNNMETARKLIEKSKMETGYKNKFLDFIEMLEKRKF